MDTYKFLDLKIIIPRNDRRSTVKKLKSDLPKATIYRLLDKKNRLLYLGYSRDIRGRVNAHFRGCRRGNTRHFTHLIETAEISFLQDDDADLEMIEAELIEKELIEKELIEKELIEKELIEKELIEKELIEKELIEKEEPYFNCNRRKCNLFAYAYLWLARERHMNVGSLPYINSIDEVLDFLEDRGEDWRTRCFLSYGKDLEKLDRYW